MLIASPPKRGSSNASSARIVCLQFLQVCSRRDSLAMTFLRCSDCVADGSTLSSHWAEQKAPGTRGITVFVVVPQKARVHHVCAWNSIVSRDPLVVQIFLGVSFVHFLLHFVVVLGAWPLLADQYGVVLQGNQNSNDWRLANLFHCVALHGRAVEGQKRNRT